MTEHFFDLHGGHLSDDIDDIIRPLGAWHTNYTEPNGTKRGWFACRNLGNPFDAATEREVREAIAAAGGIEAFRIVEDR